MKKRVLSILMALCLCLTLLPTAAMAVTGTELTENNIGSNMTLSNGEYYLDGNVTISSTLTITGTVTLDLNGYVLKYNNKNGSVIKIESGGNLTLTDSNTSAPNYFDSTWAWEKDATEQPTDGHTVTGGVITGGTGTAERNGTVKGGGVYVAENGTFTMEGGHIVGCAATGAGSGGAGYGGGVYVDYKGAFTMSGGSIRGCTAIGAASGGSGSGGGVYVSGTGEFTMDGGMIADCAAKGRNGSSTNSGSGGGVYVVGAFTMNNGTIERCAAEGGLEGNQSGSGSGGGVYANGAFTMNGGSIKSCTASSTGIGSNYLDTGKGAGGGVYVDCAACVLKGGTVSSNTASHNGGGVYVEKNKTLTVGSDSTPATPLKITDNNSGTTSATDNIYLDSERTNTAKLTVASGGLAEGSDISATMTDLDLSGVDSNAGTSGSVGYYWECGEKKILTLNNVSITGTLTLPETGATITTTGTVSVKTIVSKQEATEDLIFNDATLTVGNINWKNNDSQVTNVGLVLNNSALTVNDELCAGQITLNDATSTITLVNGSICTNYNGNMGTVPSYCPQDGETYTIGRETGDQNITCYLLKNGTKVTKITLQKRNTPTPAPSNSGSDSDPTYSITIAPTEHGGIPLRRKYAEKGETVTLTVTPDTGYTLETLTVTDKNGNEIGLTARSDGQYTFKMPACGVTVTATFMEDNTMLNFFVDVTADQYYYDAVLWAAKNGVTGGVDDTHFAPANTCTRAQLAAFLYRCAQARGEGFTGAWMFQLPFSDVPEWCYEAVAWCYMNGVVQGYSDDTFAPDRTVTRQQAVAMLYRFAQAMGLDVSVGEDTNILSYNDAFDVAEYAVEAFQWATGAGIVQGSNGNLSPAAPCTRAQIVAMLYRLLG